MIPIFWRYSTRTEWNDHEIYFVGEIFVAGENVEVLWIRKNINDRIEYFDCNTFESLDDVECPNDIDEYSLADLNRWDDDYLRYINMDDWSDVVHDMCPNHCLENVPYHHESRPRRFHASYEGNLPA